MANPVRKPYRNSDIKKILPLKESIDSLEKAETTLHDIERKGLEDSAVTAGKYYDMLQQLGGSLPGMASFIADSEKTISTLYRVGIEMTEFCHNAASDLMLVSREMMDCQSFDELYTLQNIATQQLSKRWHDEVSRMSCMAFASFGASCILPPD